MVKESAMSSDSMEVLDYAAELRSGPGFAWNMFAGTRLAATCFAGTRMMA